MQARQRGVAGAEVVEHDADADAAEMLEHAGREREVPRSPSRSVISTTRCRDSRPFASSISAGVRPDRSRGTGGSAKLTLTRGRRPPRAGAATRAAARQTSSESDGRSDWSRPFSSMIGMKSAGGTMPRSGCRQRSSASKPASRPVRRSMIGWKYGQELVALERRGARPYRAGRARAPARAWRASKTSERALAARLGAIHRRVGVAQHFVGRDVAARARWRCRCWRS